VGRVELARAHEDIIDLEVDVAVQEGGHGRF